MALEELVYYRLDLNKRRIMRTLISHIARTFSFHEFESEQPYTLNIPLLLYAVAGELHADILYKDCKIYCYGVKEHLSAYLHHYLGEFHENGAPTIALKIPDVVEFTGTILHYDTDVQSQHPNTSNRNGIVFAYESGLHDCEGFIQSLKKFLPHFDCSIKKVMFRFGFTYERFDLVHID